jgi:TIR domain
MSDVFISYTQDDRVAAGSIADRLSHEGFTIFLDREVLVAGEDWSARIVNEIRSARAVLALLSSTSRKNKWVADELQVALDSKAVVIPVLLDKGAKDNWLWPLLATRQSVELNLTSADRKSQLDNLVRVLSAALGKREPDAAARQVEAAARAAEAAARQAEAAASKAASQIEAASVSSSAPSKPYILIAIVIALVSAALSALITLAVSR